MKYQGLESITSLMANKDLGLPLAPRGKQEHWGILCSLDLAITTSRLMESSRILLRLPWALSMEIEARILSLDLVLTLQVLGSKRMGQR